MFFIKATCKRQSKGHNTKSLNRVGVEQQEAHSSHLPLLSTSAPPNLGPPASNNPKHVLAFCCLMRWMSAFSLLHISSVRSFSFCIVMNSRSLRRT